MHDLSRRFAVVTGASSGLGAALVGGLVGCGARVAAVARRSGPLEALADELGDAVLPCAADVTDPAAVDALADRVHSLGGVPDVLVNAAGIFGPIASVVDSDPGAWWATLSTNTFAPYLTCRAFVPGMVELGWGRIFNVSSAASLHPPGPLNSAYATSKVALNQLTRHLAVELDGTGVTANVLHPGDVKTAMWEDIRRQALAAGDAGRGFLAWTEWVEQTGGDPPHKAVDLILEQVASPSTVTGQFLWIDSPIQPLVPAWEEASSSKPWD